MRIGTKQDKISYLLRILFLCRFSSNESKCKNVIHHMSALERSVLKKSSSTKIIDGIIKGRLKVGIHGYLHKNKDTKFATEGRANFNRG